MSMRTLDAQPKETSAKLARWALCLQDYDIAIDYRAGKVNQNADCLSRIPETDGATTKQPEVIRGCVQVSI